MWFFGLTLFPTTYEPAYSRSRFRFMIILTTFALILKLVRGKKFAQPRLAVNTIYPQVNRVFPEKLFSDPYAKSCINQFTFKRKIRYCLILINAVIIEIETRMAMRKQQIISAAAKELRHYVRKSSH